VHRVEADRLSAIADQLGRNAARVAD
jgi:hypothetical protein